MEKTYRDDSDSHFGSSNKEPTNDTALMYAQQQALINSINPNALMPMQGVMQGGQRNNHFLEYQMAHEKSFSEKLCFRTGVLYGSGLILGGSWGLVGGLRDGQGASRKLLINSILNNCGRRGSLIGNKAGVLGLSYTFAEGILSFAKEDTSDVASGVIAGAITGGLFRASAGVRVAGMAAVAGGLVMGGLRLVSTLSE
jgi:mitochondrial import inner membrane translocase subunit TIM23